MSSGPTTRSSPIRVDDFEPQSFDRVLSSTCTVPHPAALDALWPDGYRTQFERAQGLADPLAGALGERGFRVVEPVLPIVAAEIPDDRFDAFRAAGWRVSRTAADELRVVCMPHVTRETLDSFLSDLDDAGT